MAVDYIVYVSETGRELWRGTAPTEEDAEAQPAPDGAQILIVPPGTIQGLSINVEMLRCALWEQVKAKRDFIIDGGAQTPFGSVDSYELARSNIAGAALAALIAKSQGIAYSVNWTLLNNSVATLDADAMISVGMAVMAHVNACHDSARGLRTEIDEAITVTALLTIDMASGWAA